MFPSTLRIAHYRARRLLHGAAVRDRAASTNRCADPASILISIVLLLLGEMKSKAQGVQERAAAQDAIVPAGASRNVSERIRWIGDHEQERVGRGCDDTRISL